MEPEYLDEERYLCSHLVRLYRSGSSTPPEIVVLEEIATRGAVLRTERSYDTGIELMIEADGLLAPALVESCRRAAGDYELEVGFLEDFTWTRSAWEPDHLYAVQGMKQKARSARGTA